MSSFFTLPASQKRKRTGKSSSGAEKARRSKPRDDESISGSDISEDEGPGRERDDEEGEEEDLEDEDPAAKRVRLAEQYLANTQREVLEEDGGFDAAEVDRENLSRRMGERLTQDTAESKGKLYRWLANDLEWQKAKTRCLRSHHVRKSYTGVAMQGRYVYAVTKDMHLVKWELPSGVEEQQKGRRLRTSPRIVASRRGDRKDKKSQTHHAAILCIAASEDGKFVATGGEDKKLVVWDASTLKPLKAFTQHRDSVTALAFRRGTNQLFSASKDRTVKIWSLDELAYVETLFGHQDEVLDVGGLGEEQCVTVGARDRTARLWKVVEESQLVFRGGGAPSKSKSIKALRSAYEEDSAIDLPEEESHHEGSIDRIALVDNDTFVTAADNGSLSLWDIRKKKPVSTIPFAHGLDPAIPLHEASADIHPDEQLDERSRGGKHPRWITALKAIPFSDIIVSGSWDGCVRAWKISQDKRHLEPLGAIQPRAKSNGTSDATQDFLNVNGIINDLAIVDQGERAKNGVLVAAAVGKEHRLARWKQASEDLHQNSIVLFEVPRKHLKPIANGVNGHQGSGGENHKDNGFEGFD